MLTEAGGTITAPRHSLQSLRPACRATTSLDCSTTTSEVPVTGLVSNGSLLLPAAACRRCCLLLLLLLQALLDVFFDRVDPTTLNRQGNDSGTQYRS